MIWILLISAAVVILLDFLLRKYAKFRIADMFENVPPFNVTTAAENPNARRLSIHSASGLTLSGSLLWPQDHAPHGLVIFFPELNGNHWMASRYCEGLLQNGFAVLGFDFRNQGESDCDPAYSPIHWITDYEMQDVEAVLEFIESDPEFSTMPLLAFGVSRGGVAALIAGSRYPRIRAVIADSAFGTLPMMHHFVNRFVRLVIPGWLYALLPWWHIRIALRQGIQVSQKRRHCRYLHLEDEASGLSETPVLLISGQRDSYVTQEVAAALHSTVGEHSELWTVEKAKHNMARSVQPQEYDRRVVEHAFRALDIRQVEPQEVSALGESN